MTSTPCGLTVTVTVVVTGVGGTTLVVVRVCIDDRGVVFTGGLGVILTGGRGMILTGGFGVTLTVVRTGGFGVVLAVVFTGGTTGAGVVLGGSAALDTEALDATAPETGAPDTCAPDTVAPDTGALDAGADDGIGPLLITTVLGEPGVGQGGSCCEVSRLMTALASASVLTGIPALTGSRAACTRSSTLSGVQSAAVPHEFSCTEANYQPSSDPLTPRKTATWSLLSPT